MQKVYVKIACMTFDRTPLRAGETPSLDKKVDKKLWDLGLVEDYNEKKHGKAKADNAGAIKELTAENAILTAKVEELVGFLEVSITLAKDKVPDGYVKAK